MSGAYYNEIDPYAAQWLRMTDTTMNTGAASLSDEQREQLNLIERCDPSLLIQHIEEDTAYDGPLVARVFELAKERARSLLATPTPQADADFKNFHRLLCERFDYVHDEGDWKRDQLSLIEHIASRAAIAAGGAQEVESPEAGKNPELEWHWSTSDEGPMYPAGTDDMAEALSYALYESGITTFGEDPTTIFLCRFRPMKIDWRHHADWLLEHIDDTVIDHVAEGDVPTDQTDVDALAAALASIVKVNASAAYDNRQYSPGDSEYETALSRGRNDEAAAPAASNGEQA